MVFFSLILSLFTLYKSSNTQDKGLTKTKCDRSEKEKNDVS